MKGKLNNAQDMGKWLKRYSRRKVSCNGTMNKYDVYSFVKIIVFGLYWSRWSGCSGLVANATTGF